MSYSRRFRRTVEVPYEKTEMVSYPASQNGGRMPVTVRGTARELVEVDIHVDTTPFDSSVVNCNQNINGLTASVGALNTAQCVAIAENAEKVSKTIIDGFFHTVRTDLSTQKVELEQTIEARLMLLRQQAASLKEKQKTMAEDYARTTARYQKLFADLNNELSVRVHQADQPVFDLVKEVDAQSDRMLHTDMVQTAVTMSKESSILQAQIGVATVKHHALESMNQVQGFLASKATTEKTILNSCIEGSGKDPYYVPVCFLKTESENHRVESQCIIPDFCSSKNQGLQQKLCNHLDNVDWGNDSENNTDLLHSYIQSEIANNLAGDDRHSNRIKELINKMLNN